MTSSHAVDLIKIPPGFWAGLRELEMPAQEVIRRAGLPVAVMNEPAGVTAAQYFALWQAYADLSPDVAQAIIRLSAAFDTAQYPPTVLATYHARDYRDALYRMARYKQMCPPERLTIAEHGETCTIDLDWQSAGRPGPPVLAGITLATLLELGRRGTGLRVTAKFVEFSRPMGDVQALEAYFGSRVLTGAKHDRLTLHRSDLDLPFVSYNEELLEILTPALDRTLDERQRGRTVIGTVGWIVKRGLAGERLDIQSVAGELGMSDRSLQRRLAEEGTSFKRLLTEARHEQALAYLLDPSLEIKAIAFLLGYEDQNSFYRAFRTWEGDTPARWRSEHSARPGDTTKR